MREENRMESRVTVLSRHYYGSIISLMLVFLLVLFRVIPLFGESELISITLERYSLMISLIAIPLSLRLFAWMLKKVSRPVATEMAMRVYTKASHLRLYTISAVTLLNILLFGMSRNTNFLWMTAVLFVIFLYCKPSFVELSSLTTLPEGKSTTEEEGMEDLEKEDDDEEAAGK